MTLSIGKTRAFTLIEILFVIIIIGILLGISLPNFRKAFNNLQLNNFSAELQTFVNYMHDRCVVEGKAIYLNIDADKKEYWAQIKDDSKVLKTYHIPDGVEIETSQKQIIFYPDGTIDKVTISLSNPDKQTIVLTTEGVFGGIKQQDKE